VLQKETGYTVEFYPVTNRAAASEALKFERVDFVLTGPAEYVVMKKRANASAVVGFSRPDYYSAIIVLADSGLTKVSQLKGKKIGFSTVGSTSGHLGPMQILADNGINPLKDIEVVNLKTQLAFESLKRGDIAALGFGDEKFKRWREDEFAKGGLPPGAFRIIARGPDLPNDVLMAGAHVDKEVVAKIKAAFVARSNDLIAAMLKGTLNQKYKGMQFLPTVRDEDYDYVRSMYKTAGYPEYSDFIGD
jgi:phosphonate transport system substrate-binding protein